MSRACTFFGQDLPLGIALNSALRELILCHAVGVFYVGNDSWFDRRVQLALRALQKTFPDIRCVVVTADHAPLAAPLEIVRVDGSPAEWMLERCEFVVTCIRHPLDAAADCARRAREMNKKIITL